jgi:hypothetical protein
MLSGAFEFPNTELRKSSALTISTYSLYVVIPGTMSVACSVTTSAYWALDLVVKAKERAQHNTMRKFRMEQQFGILKYNKSRTDRLCALFLKKKA